MIQSILKSSILLFLILFVVNAKGQTIVDDPSFSFTTSVIDVPSTIHFALPVDNKSQILTLGGSAGIIKIDSLGKKISSFTSGSYQVVGGSPLNGMIQTFDAKFLTFGRFDGYSGHSSKGVLRLNNSGSVDPSFMSPITNSDAVVETVVELPDHKYLCSVLSDFTGQTTLMKLNINGSIDATFTSPFPTSYQQNISEFIVNPDSTILIVFETYIQKIDLNGTIDPSFDSTPVGNQMTYGFSDCQVLPNQKILFLSGNKIYQLFDNGSIDNSFTPIDLSSPQFYAKRIVLSNSNPNKFYVYGKREIFTFNPTKLVSRYYLDGSIDNSFDPNLLFDSEGNYMEIYSLNDFGNKISVVGQFDDINDVAAVNALMLDEMGAPVWLHKNGQGLYNYAAFTVHVDVNGSIFIGGEFDTYNGANRTSITKLTPNGHTDYSFKCGTGFIGRVRDIITQPDGKIIVVGEIINYNGVTIKNIVRLNANGSIDNTFNVGTGLNGGSGFVKAVGLQSDGKIIVGGNFNLYNGIAVQKIVRLFPNGTIDPTFATSGGADGTILDLIVKPNDEILICGEFGQYAGVTRARIALLDSDGNLNTSFVPSVAYAHTDIRAMAIQDDGKIIVGGDFNSYTDHVDRRLGRLKANGSTDSSFVSNANNYNFPEALGILPNGNIIVGCGTISIINANGTMLANNTLSLMAGASVNDLYINPAGNPLLVGQFYLDINKMGISRLKLVPAIHHTVNIQSCQPYTWIDGVTYAVNNSTATYTYTDIYGVDSIVHLNLNILNNHISDIQTSCDPLVWLDGNTYPQSTNIPVMIYTNINGCDSVVHLNFTRLQKDSIVENHIACNSFTWTDGITYNQTTNTPVQILTNSAGCDSVVYLDLTVNNFESEINYNGFGTLSSLNGYVVEWLDCDNNTAIPGVFTNSFQPSNNGSYSVIASNGACIDTSFCLQIDNLGLESNSISEVVVYPSPSNDVIKFKYQEQIEMNLIVRSLIGAIVLDTQVMPEEPLSIANLESGVYFYEIQIGEKMMNGFFEKINQ